MKPDKTFKTSNRKGGSWQRQLGSGSGSPEDDKEAEATMQVASDEYLSEGGGSGMKMT